MNNIIKRTSILLLSKIKTTETLYSYNLKIESVNGIEKTYISIIASNDNTFKVYLRDLQHLLVDTDACMAFDDNKILSKIKPIT